jgi:hypothetical protein
MSLQIIVVFIMKKLSCRQQVNHTLSEYQASGNNNQLLILKIFKPIFVQSGFSPNSFILQIKDAQKFRN